MSAKQRMVGIIGAGQASEQGWQQAVQVGRLLAEAGVVLVCGGLGGVMEAAAKGCAEAGGAVIGVLPGASAAEANPYISLPIVTNMGHARNVIIAHTAEVLIAIEGELGTLSEIAIALKLGKPVLQLNSWGQVAGPIAVATPEQAVQLALQKLQEGTEP